MRRRKRNVDGRGCKVVVQFWIVRGMRRRKRIVDDRGCRVVVHLVDYEKE
jgi:hypothetical protein